jgi:release factor glutamine methyltransferase
MSIIDSPDTTSPTVSISPSTSERALTVETTHVRVAVEAAADRFLSAGVPSPRHDAEELAAFVLGCPRSLVFTAGAFSAGQSVVFTQLVARREARVPLQHLTGSVGFRYIDLAVGPGVFVPRPETELVAGWCVDALRAGAEKSPLVVDLCTGSGAIALSIAHEVKDAVVHGVELETDAVAWATRNATGSRVTIHQADAAAPSTLADLDGTVDLVVSNPPYLPDGEIVEPEVADHDPALALWGGPDGLAGPRLVEQSARRLVRAGGHLAIEHADQHGPAMIELLTASGAWADVVVHPDLTGRDRFTTATRTGVPRPRKAQTT